MSGTCTFSPIAWRISQSSPVYPVDPPRPMSMMTLCPEGKVSQTAGHAPIGRQKMEPGNEADTRCWAISASGLAEGDPELLARFGDRDRHSLCLRTLSGLATKPDPDRELLALGRIVWRDHGIVRRQVPA